MKFSLIAKDKNRTVAQAIKQLNWISEQVKSFEEACSHLENGITQGTSVHDTLYLEHNLKAKNKSLAEVETLQKKARRNLRDAQGEEERKEAVKLKQEAERQEKILPAEK